MPEDKTSQTSSEPIQKPEPMPSTDTNSAEAHDSNPFSTSITGIKKLFKYNTGSLIGVGLFNIILGIFLLLTVAGMVIALFAWLMRHTNIEGYVGVFIPVDFKDFLAGFGDISIYATWLIGAIIILAVGTLIQIMQIKVASASVRKQEIGFGKLLKSSFSRILPLFALGALAMLFAVAALIIALALTQLGPIAIALYFVSFILVLYAGIKLSFATFAIVEDKLGPIAALKRSWEITDGHFAETLGISAAAALIVFVPMSLLGAIAQNMQNALGGILQAIISLASLVASIIALAAVAERYQQLSNIKEGKVQATKTHILNFLAPLILIIASSITSSLTPRNTDSQWQLDSNKSPQDIMRNLEGSQLQDRYDSPSSGNFNFN